MVFHTADKVSKTMFYSEIDHVQEVFRCLQQLLYLHEYFHFMLFILLLYLFYSYFL